MSNATEFLEAHRSCRHKESAEFAEFVKDNEFWLTYARHITILVLRRMEEQSVTQVELARRMGCTQQYVSNLLKGSSNMTLETIARLEKALDLDLLKSSFSDTTQFTSSNHQHIIKP